MEKLLNDKEAAEFLGVSTRTLYSYREAGLVPYRRLPSATGGPGKLIRYKASDLDRVRSGKDEGDR